METNKKPTKELLQKQLNDLAEQERKEMIKAYYPQFKGLIGKFFKTKNSYSLPKKPSDYWFIYTKITDIKKGDLYDTGNGVLSEFRGFDFQTDMYGDITINKSRKGCVHSLGDEITEQEFNEAWNKMIDSLNKLG